MEVRHTTRGGVLDKHMSFAKLLSQSCPPQGKPLSHSRLDFEFFFLDWLAKLRSVVLFINSSLTDLPSFVVSSNLPRVGGPPSGGQGTKDDALKCSVGTNCPPSLPVGSSKHKETCSDLQSTVSFATGRAFQGDAQFRAEVALPIP